MNDEKDIYDKRDFLLGQIHAYTKGIPDMKKDIADLKKKVAVIEVKSGLWGSIGGFCALALLWLKDMVGVK